MKMFCRLSQRLKILNQVFRFQNTRTYTLHSIIFSAERFTKPRARKVVKVLNICPLKRLLPTRENANHEINANTIRHLFILPAVAAGG